MVHLQHMRIPHAREQGCPCIDTIARSVPELHNRFIIEKRQIPPELSERYCTHAVEPHLQGYTKLHLQLRQASEKSDDWFEAGIAIMQPAIAIRRDALLEHRRQPTEHSLAALCTAHSDIQWIACKCVSGY